MALLGDFVEYAPCNGDFYINVTAERGTLVVHDGSGSGAALDQDAAYVAVPTGQAPSTLYPAGMLMNDVVDLDLTKTHENFYQNEIQKGGKAQLMRQGWAVTDKVSGSPTAGKKAYFTNAGLFTPTDPGNCDPVGRFLSSKDENGFAKVEVNITG